MTNRIYWIGHDQQQSDGTCTIGAPLSGVFCDEGQARQALTEIKARHSRARLLCAINLDDEQGTRRE